jgi:D-lactate dehydrogenase (cytochrome)
MRNNVLGLEVVTATGEVIRTGTRARKSSSGYDLTGLFVGAEGTLGLITELTLRLHGQPEAISSAVCAFPDVGSAVACVIDTIQMGLPMARIELMDPASVAAVNAYADVQLPETTHLLLEFHGSDAGVTEQAETFGDIAAEHGATGFDWATKSENRTRLWTMRHNAYHAILASRPGSRAVVTDLCVPISKLAQAIEETQADLTKANLPGPILGHVGDGNFHAILMFDEGDDAATERAKEVHHRMVKRALALGGTATGEHGIGIGKRRYMSEEHGPAWAVMGDIKQALDPQGILNPGKLVPPRN